MAAEEKLKWKKRAYSDLAKRLEENEALSTRAMKKLSEKQKIIQEQAKLIKDKEKDSTKLLAAAENLHETLSTFAMNKLSEKEKIIQEQANLIKEKEKAAEIFEEKELSHAEMVKRLEESEATSTRAARKLSEKQKIIQDKEMMEAQ